MRCLTDKQMQHLVDGELSANQMDKYKSHIDTCTYCAEKYSDRKELSASIKALINETAISPERIPEFRIPAAQVTQKVKVRRIPLWAKVAAVLVPAFVGWKMYNKPQEDFKPSAESIQMYEMCNGVDANTAFQENMIITTVTDENGKVVECSTN
ncbi:MAG TPA: hypothetical protein VFK73_09140 [Paludibacter sp.]|nr:hypothetical protein [Paludibacter sp.]